MIFKKAIAILLMLSVMLNFFYADAANEDADDNITSANLDSFSDYEPMFLEPNNGAITPNNDTLSNINDFHIENGVLSAYQGSGRVVHIPEGVTKIADSAFMAVTSIQALYIPDSVTIIEEGAFAGCSNLKAIRFSEALISVGDFAFL